MLDVIYMVLFSYIVYMTWYILHGIYMHTWHIFHLSNIRSFYNETIFLPEPQFY